MEAEDLAALLNEYLAALETTTPRPKPGRVSDGIGASTLERHAELGLLVHCTVVRIP